MTDRKGTNFPLSDEQHLDIAANRRARKWTHKELAGRVLWALMHPLFAWSPRLLWGWRRFLMRLFGARIGRSARILPSVRITIPWNLTIGEDAVIGDRVILYALGPLSIGRQVTISQGAHLCGGTHDYTRADFPLVKAPIWIENGVWVCADAFVGPGVRVGEYAILAARSVVTKDVASWTIVAGNPARLISVRPQIRAAKEPNLA